MLSNIPIFIITWQATEVSAQDSAKASFQIKLKYQAEPNLSRDSKQYVIAIFNNITSGVIIVINTVCNKHYIIRLINTSICIL